MDALIKLDKIRKSFPKPDKQELLVLEDVDLSLRQGEIVALLGKSGSGKSTLLRIIAGLVEPSDGSIKYRNKPVHGPVHGISMVFQHFALMPWLTVLQNVELGLEAQGVPREERRQRALKAIDTIGLDGFESAFPKELSGGMRQRVGVARALVVNPDVLLMDEPFSALDVLTAENLRSDLLDLWQQKQTPLKSILCVTHDITEAAIMADRILVFDSDPGCIRTEINVDLPHPRDEDDPKVKAIVDDIYTAMTSMREEKPAATYQHKDIDFGYRLPDIEVSELTGLLEEIGYDEERTGKKIFHLQDLAESLHLDVDDLFPLIDALDFMRFARIIEGDISPTPAGEKFAEADILEKKEIFARHLLQYVPLAKYIRHKLDDASGHRMNEEKFLDELEQYFSQEEAKRVLTTAIEWGRYAEIFAYNVNNRVLSLEDPN
jgi:NitT/TauT family transport system ATP-binding protein